MRSNEEEVIVSFAIRQPVYEDLKPICYQMPQELVLFVNPRRLTLHYLPRSWVLPSIQFLFVGTRINKYKIDEPSFRGCWSLLKEMFQTFIDYYALEESKPLDQFRSLDPIIRVESNRHEIVEAFNRLIEFRDWCIRESGAYGKLPGGWGAIPAWKRPKADKIIEVRNELKMIDRCQYRQWFEEFSKPFDAYCDRSEKPQAIEDTKKKKTKRKSK